MSQCLECGWQSPSGATVGDLLTHEDATGHHRGWLSRGGTGFAMWVERTDVVEVEQTP